jgi:hypothetical protein
VAWEQVGDAVLVQRLSSGELIRLVGPAAHAWLQLAAGEQPAPDEVAAAALDELERAGYLV